ncbi:MAG TPA: class I SAM-dependent methyltransferase, partial [Armatimonadota bacterium]|nr:class I SAM-dependent methyltransferase [Armatimonadota bacterium]
VLDLACGTGNVLRELLRRGYEAEGADASPAMIEVARRKFPADVPLWCQDARFLDLPSPPFDACVCLFDSLNYLLEPADLQRAFRAIHRHLKPGGSLVFDMNAIRALETGMFDQKGTGRDASLEYAWESAWDPISRLCTIQMEFRSYERAGTRVFHETHVQKGYTLREVTRLLDLASFEVLAVYDAFSTRPPNPKTDRFYVVARAIGA